ncbi:hypothetical protein EXIGLDRAFT_410933 [Exidia glandulosa HHB12029]|uniref:Uncharacterized protein n=1 Tax=Exidia glandulosa HHB12029 TaxID=1314781 RepID=A0A165KNP5_EXIGL|nr:hypothetical protein EXIGLDRAFT_410933 [Exidia glandulosa HHB12029]
MHARCDVPARTVYLALSHRRATVLLGPSRRVVAYTTQAHPTFRLRKPIYSVPLFARNTYLDGLREAAARARTPDEVVRVMQMVRAAPAAELEWDGMETVILVLGFRRDPRLLRALVDSKLFRPWYGSRHMTATAYSPLFTALLAPHGLRPLPTDSEVYGIITELKSRGGMFSPTLSRTLASLYDKLGRTLPPEIAEAINIVAELPVGIDFNIAKWTVYITAERRTRSWRDVLTTVLPYLWDRRMPPNTISALLADETWQPSDIEEIAQALGTEVDTGVISCAVDTALKSSGARAGKEVFRYAQSKGLYLSHRASQHLIAALVAFRNSFVVRPDDVSTAVDVFWRQVDPDSPTTKSHTTDSHHLRPLPLLSALATTIGMERRWEMIRDIVSFSQRNGIAVVPNSRRQISDLYERMFLCSSHADCLLTLSAHRDLAYDELYYVLHTVGKFRYDSAPTLSYSDFIIFLTHVESCGHVVRSDMVLEWLKIVHHSLVQLSTSWEQDTLGSSAQSHDNHAASYLRQLEEDLLSKQPSLDTDAVRARLMGAYGVSTRPHDEDILRCWARIVDRNAVSDDILVSALNATRSLSNLRRVWADTHRQGFVPSVATWARYALRLIIFKRHDEAFDIFSQRVGDDPTYRHIAVALFVRSRQDALERYARELPKIWNDPRTRADLLRARTHRRTEGALLHPQHYDFIV